MGTLALGLIVGIVIGGLGVLGLRSPPRPRVEIIHPADMDLEARLTKALSEQIEWRARALDPQWMKHIHANRDLADFVPPPKDPTQLDRWLEGS